MAFAIRARMSRSAHSESASRGRRRLAILLAILLLVGLPIYLWPFRGGVQGLPGGASRSGVPRDPRSAAAIAQLPADVWDGLMGHRTHREGPKRPGNLTRISPLEDGAGHGALGGAAGAATVDLPGPTLAAMLADAGTAPGGGPSLLESGPGSSSAAEGDEHTGNAWNGGYWPFSGIGPFGGGGGPGGTAGSPLPTFVAIQDPTDSPTPTPEPSTLMLVGSNLTLAGAVAWRYVRKRQERKPSG